MRNAAVKAPGKVWWVISFVPAINWASLLYIGITSKNLVNIICALAYCALTLAFRPILLLLWVVGFVHYAIAYGGVKRKNSEASNSPAPRAKTTYRRNRPQKHQEAREFSNVTVTGTFESKKATRVSRASVPDRVQRSVQTNTSHGKFFSDMQRYASFEGRPAAFTPFVAFWPTYDSMNKPQQEYYFFLRSQVRGGSYPDTDLSYLFVYIYELLSGVGWQSPRQGYEMLAQIWSAYKNRIPALNRYMHDWVFDFTRLHNLEYKAPSDEDDSIRMEPSPMTDILIEQHADDIPLKLPFALIDALCDYSLVNSKFYKDGNQDLIREAIPRVVALADAALRKKTQNGVLATYGPSVSEKKERCLFSGAVCPQANVTMTLTTRAYSTNPKLREYINELVRYGENTLRELRNCRGRLRGITLEGETATFIEAFLKKEYGQLAAEPIDESKKVGASLNLDLDSISILREQSDAVRVALQVEEGAVSVERALLTDVQAVSAVYIAISPEARGYLEKLEKSDWECDELPEDEVYITEINRSAELYLGCALLMKEKNTIAAEDDYRDELAYISENPPPMSEAGNSAKLFDLSSAPSELKELIESLVPEQQKALKALLCCESPESELERIAEEAQTMPQIIIDDINELAMRVLGDLIVDSMGLKPRVMDEYAADLRACTVSLGG